MSAYVYVRSEPQLLTVGHYDPAGKWHSDSDHDTREAAAARCAYLNGDRASPALAEALRAMVNAHDTLVSDTEGHYPRPDTGCIDCTLGTVPDRFNTGLCAYHRARAALTAAGIE
jgi:hypothetical protein